MFRRLWRRDRWHLWHSAEGLLGAIDAGRLPTYSFVEPCHNAANGSLNEQSASRQQPIHRQRFRKGGRADATDLYAAHTQPRGVQEDGANHHVRRARWDTRSLEASNRCATGVRPSKVSSSQVHATVDHLARQFRNNYGFGRLGMRVPTVIVSPWMPPGHIDDTVYDHASIVASLRRLWAPTQRPLSDRDKAAFDILELLADPNAPANIADPPPEWTDSGAFAAPIGRALVWSEPHRSIHRPIRSRQPTCLGPSLPSWIAPLCG